MVVPPGSPASSRDLPSRPMSAIIRPNRSSSRMSISSRGGAASRASDDDARTSVKVAVRVRPPLQPSDPGYDLIPQRFQKNMVHISSPTSIAVDSPQGRKIFVFDRVFGEEVSQDGIWDYLEDSVGAFLQGYNVSVLAYGQSGAGKSYTMGTAGPGDQLESDTMGVIPRAAIGLFDRLGGTSGNRNSGIRAPVRYSTPIATLQRQNPDKGWTMKATYVEIYNESLRDLLLPEGTRPEERAPITIREDTKGRILLTGLRQVEINNVEDLLGALSFGSSIRQTDATAINAKSSRSHAVFSLNLVQRKVKGVDGGDKASKRFSMPMDMGAEGFMTVDSKMHFVDLAGSERLKNTHAQGERAKEGISINAGLASLGKVISQLSSRQSGSHVSYRDSKLTRLLQDSLGGNAITYMIACVTPAEFHLSETLNTIQYAQRARAIQSKPRIQQVSDDGDLKQLIDRLRAEIAFLREQLKNSSESNDNCKDLPGARNGRSAEKEIELQNQLLDLQESYTALSQRHAKLISEMTKARDSEQVPPSPTTEYADSAVERLKRSNSFAEAVEKVVLEYEKTIQSLETSLSSTRSSLSNSESSLMEKESKLAYVETLNQQLQTRLHKMMDRESSTETYLHDLEMKLSGHTSGEEKNAAIVTELKNEIARLRENETGCEDYISTLEERLAESEQDQELLQREIARLEHVIERQRSLGKLDNLLLELDSIKEIKENGTNGDLAEHKSDEGEWSSTAKSDYEFTEQFVDGAADESPRGTRSPPPPPLSGTPPIEESPAEDDYIPGSANLRHDDVYKYEPHSPAQSQFVADKLESVQQELFDLKVEHEQTITEFDQINANYEVALRNLATLQEQVDEMRRTQSISAPTDATSPPESPIERQNSFLVDTGVGGLKGSEARPSSSPSLSSGPCSPGESTTPIDSPITDAPPYRSINDAESKIVEETLCREIEALKRKHKKEQERLHQQLRQSREQLADLKSVEYRNGGNSPTALIRRKSNQSLAVLDRVQRAFSSLRRIATEYLADQPDVLENFNLNIESALQELQNRSKRISELENDITVLRKDLETKNTMIAGLTRERTSIQSSPMDISVVAVMERRIEESEGRLHRARLLIAEREHELASAKQALESHSNQSQSEAVSLLEELTNERRLNAEQVSKIAELQSELEMFGHSQNEALNSLQQSKEVAERNHREELAELKEAAEQHELEIRTSFDKEMGSCQKTIELLQETISDNKQTIDSQYLRVSELEKSQAEMQEEMSYRSASASEDELKKHLELVTELDRTIAESKEQIVNQQIRLETLEQSYHDTVKQLEVLRQEKEDALDALSQAEERAIAEAAANAAAHKELLDSAQSELTESKQSLAKLQTSYDEANSLVVTLKGEKVAAYEEFLTSAQSELTESKQSLAKLQASYDEANSLVVTLKSEKAAVLVENAQCKELLEHEVEQHKETIASHAAALQSLYDTQKKRDREMQELAVKEKKHTRLLEDLEQQLTLTFDRSQESSARLASVTKDYEQATQELSESRSVIDGLNAEITKLKTKLSEVEMELQGLTGAKTQRSNSTSSTGTSRKSGAALPSPPPAIPLPPLPTSPPTSASPPPGSMSRHQSKDFVGAQIDEQDARIKSLEKQLQAEKALTTTLEEALTDCERTMTRLTTDRDSFQAKAVQVQQELEKTKNESQSSRYSMQAVEEERLARLKAEQARAQLEERMQALKQKNKRSFACF